LKIILARFGDVRFSDFKQGNPPSENKTKSSDKMNIIQAGQTLKARSVCDSECVFTAEVIARNGAFATVKVQGNTKRVKVINHGDGEFLYAMGKYSMCPIFRAI
jgi:hypothetical protein